MRKDASYSVRNVGIQEKCAIYAVGYIEMQVKAIIVRGWYFIFFFAIFFGPQKNSFGMA